MSYFYAKFEENPCVGTDESTPLPANYFNFRITLQVGYIGLKCIKNDGFESLAVHYTG